MQTAIDLAPTLNTVVLPLLTSAVLALAGWVLSVIAIHFHIVISSTQRALVESAIQNGIAFAQGKLAPGEKLTASGDVSAVLGYVLPKIPGALAWLKVSPDSLAQLITARLPAQ